MIARVRGESTRRSNTRQVKRERNTSFPHACILGVWVALSAHGCSPTANKRPKEHPPEPSTSSEKAHNHTEVEADGVAVQFDMARGEQIFNNCERANASLSLSYWRLATDELLAADRIMMMVLGAQVGPLGKHLGAKPDEYVRHYVGITKAEKRLVHATGMHVWLANAAWRAEVRGTDREGTAPDWRHFKPTACDASAAVFSATIDLSHQRVVDFDFSSPAWNCCESTLCDDAIRCICIDGDGARVPGRELSEDGRCMRVGGRSPPEPGQ